MKKISLVLITAATLALGGVAMAQSTANPPSSTAGAGCTATGNAMRGGNLGGSPSSTACGQGAATTAAAPAGTTTTESKTGTGMGMGMGTGGATGMGNSGAPAGTAPMRVARAPRADRN